MSDIILKNRDGDDVTYPGVEAVNLVTADGGTQVFSKGQAVEGMVILPDFSAGDQDINAPEGILVKSATIQKPSTLIPENIRSGVQVAGVAGEYGAETETRTVALDFSAGDQVIQPTAGKLLSAVTVQQPDTLIPENIAEGVDIAGIIGAMAGGGIAFAGGTITGTGAVIELEHGLGVVPDLFYIEYTYSITSGKALKDAYIFSDAAKDVIGHAPVKYGQYNMWMGSYGGSASFAGPATSTDASQLLNSADSTKITVGSKDYPLQSGKVYFWYAIGGLT